MPPFNHFTTKAKEVIRKSHELAIERGQNNVNAIHLLAALVFQEESLILSLLERLEIDVELLDELKSALGRVAVDLPQERTALCHVGIKLVIPHAIKRASDIEPLAVEAKLEHLRPTDEAGIGLGAALCA